MSLEVIDLTLDDIDEDDAAEECISLSSDGESYAQRYQNNEEDLEGFRPDSPAESVDSRDELYSLADMSDPPNLNCVDQSGSDGESHQGTIELEVEDDPDAEDTEPDDDFADCILDDRRSYQCSYCNFTTVVEEWFHKHTSSHVPGTKPHKQRVYCPDCSYSTGSLNFLFFHMLKIHEIFQPLFYRIGEKRYQCHYCQISTELRIDIEGHVTKHLPDPKKRVRVLGLRFKCPVINCRVSYENVKDLPRHIKKTHNVANPTCYKERDDYRYFYHCFKCSFFTPYITTMNEHALKHYSKSELMQPFKYICPATSCKFSSGKKYRIVRHLKVKHSSVGAYYKLDSTSFKCFSCGARKRNTRDMVEHCRKHRKTKRKVSCQ